RWVALRRGRGARQRAARSRDAGADRAPDAATVAGGEAGRGAAAGPPGGVAGAGDGRELHAVRGVRAGALAAGAAPAPVVERALRGRRGGGGVRGRLLQRARA